MISKRNYLSLNVPRYTSYPTAPHFHSGIDENIYRQWLNYIKPNTSTSLYLHIPFCKKLCWFCGCNTKVVNRYDSISKYLDLLHKEIGMVAEQITSPKISHVHFGGGSPSIIKPGDFQKLNEHLRQNFDFSTDVKIAVEIDPRTVDEGKIAAYAKAGVNRASIGVQDFNKNVQLAINRIQPFHTVYNTTQILREYGISNINMDLIYGLPHQSLDNLLDTINLTITLEPDRISLFGYAHVPWMKKNQQLIDESTLPNTDIRQEMFLTAKNVLIEQGYIPIGLDHFALPDDELVKAQKEQSLQRNFQGYTADTSEVLLGLGISSIGSLSQGYIQNTSSPSEYASCIKDGKLPTVKGIEITKGDILRRDIILTLMCHLTVDLKVMANKHGMPNQSFSEELYHLQDFCAEGWVKVDNEVISVTEQGRIALRIIVSVFDTYLKPQTQKHSAAM